MTGIILIILIIIIFAVNGRRLQLVEKKNAASFVRDSFGKPSKRKLSERRKKSLDNNLGYYLKDSSDHLDELTWSDTGMEDIFLQMDNCFCSFGEEYLYRRLHDLSLSKDEIEDTDRIISEIYEDEKLRQDLSLPLHFLRRANEGSLPEYIEKIENTDHILNPFLHIICDLLYIPVVVVTFFSPLTAAVLLIIILLFQISTYFSFRKKADDCLSGFSVIMRLSSLAGTLPQKKDSLTGKLIEELDTGLKQIKLKTALSVFLAGSGSSGGIFSMLFTYLNLIFHFDLIAAEFLLSKISMQKETILSAYEKTGFLDMCISAASYREFLSSKAGFTRPEFTDEPGIIITMGYNPLLDSPVPNDTDNKGGMLITGSNASGKSTYMRMIAVNVILAQTIATCPASSYKASLFNVFSSIAVNDSIIRGESYFMAEINSLKRIVDAASVSRRPVICFIDEIFKGTNTAERIAAANAVLHYLRDEGVIVYAATHDLELTTLASDRYTNVHFSEIIAGNDVSFTYKLEEGPSKSRNAIALLRIKGFPENVIAESEKVCLSLDEKANKNVY